MKREEKLAFISKNKKWYHTIYLGDDVTTEGDPGNNQQKWKLIRSVLPNRLSGDDNFADFGAAEGYFSAKMIQKGCNLGVCFERCPNMMKKFDFVMKCIFGDNNGSFILRNKGLIDDYVLQNMDTKKPVFNYVIALAVIHWLKHPTLFLEYLAKATRKIAFVEIKINDIDEEGMRTTRKGKNMIKWDIGKKLFTRLVESYGFNKIVLLDDYITSFGSHRALYALYK